MESVPTRIDAFSDAEWNAAWHFRPAVSRLQRQLGADHRRLGRDTLLHAAYYAAGKLHEEDFHLFSNGGQPLLKRHRGAWMDEVLFHRPPTDVEGHYCPAAIEIMVHFEPLREIRMKVSRSCAMVPATVGVINIGQLQSRQSKTLWNLECNDCITEIGNLLKNEGLAWIEDLCDPVTLEDRVIAGSLPFIDDATGLEMVLALGGKLGARRVIDNWRNDPIRGPKLERELNRLRRQFGPVYRGDDVGSNVAVLCLCFDLVQKSAIRP